jgi:(E)-4-hydroxy-3-methylbut-2-enyl-diphosphate synthase
MLSVDSTDDADKVLTDGGYTAGTDGTLISGTMAADYIYVGNEDNLDTISKGIYLISEYKTWKENRYSRNHYYPILDIKSYSEIPSGIIGLHFLRVSALETNPKLLEILDTDIFGIIVLEVPEKDSSRECKLFFNQLARRNCRMPVILYKKYNSASLDDLIIKASGELGPFLLEGLGDGIWIEETNPEISYSRLREISFGILQSSGMRISKTEFISCPGCGRTLFNLQAVSQKIREATSHLKGLKIAIMGCIVNGPGEMADADYGYVGAGPGKISLYKGKEAVKKGLPEENALEELINLIKSEGDWIEIN